MFTGSLTCFNFVEHSFEVQIVLLFVTHQKVYLRLLKKEIVAEQKL